MALTGQLLSGEPDQTPLSALKYVLTSCADPVSSNPTEVHALHVCLTVRSSSLSPVITKTLPHGSSIDNCCQRPGHPRVEGPLLITV